MKRTLMLFSARYCGKCHAADKRIRRLTEKNSLNFEYLLIDIEVDKDLVKKYNIEGVPTLISLEGNQELKRTSGTILPEKILEFLE